MIDMIRRRGDFLHEIQVLEVARDALILFGSCVQVLILDPQRHLLPDSVLLNLRLVPVLLDLVILLILDLLLKYRLCLQQLFFFETKLHQVQLLLQSAPLRKIFLSLYLNFLEVAGHQGPLLG